MPKPKCNDEPEVSTTRALVAEQAHCRQRLLYLTQSGQLRELLENRTGGPDTDVVDLIVDICLRYTTLRLRIKP